MCVNEALMSKIKKIWLQVYFEKREQKNQDPEDLNNQQNLDNLRNFNKFIHIPDSIFRFSKVDFSNFFNDEDCYNAILASNVIWIYDRMHPPPLIILSICTIDDIVYVTIIPRKKILQNTNKLFPLLEMKVVNILSKHKIRKEYFWEI